MAGQSRRSYSGTRSALCAEQESHTEHHQRSLVERRGGVRVALLAFGCLSLLYWPGEAPVRYVLSYHLDVSVATGAAMALPACGRGVMPEPGQACLVDRA